MTSLNKKILIIEDDVMISSMYKTELENNGFTIIIAANGVDGLKSAREEKPDLILLDIILPQLDGFSVLEELKKDKEVKDILVVMLTNLGTEEDKAKGEEKGADGYFVKASLTPAQVSKKVKEYLSV